MVLLFLAYVLLVELSNCGARCSKGILLEALHDRTMKGLAGMMRSQLRGTFKACCHNCVVEGTDLAKTVLGLVFPL